MKRVITLFLMACSVSLVSAQSIEDVLRYSNQNLSGTARYRALSGAFGALGGDLSAISHNPAGSAVFTTTELGASLSNFTLENNSNFFGTSTTADESLFDISQFGAVFVFNEGSGRSDWKKITLGLNYELSNNLNQDIFVAGINPNNSIDQYFLAFADGVPLSLLQLQGGESIDDLYQFLGETEGFGAQQAFLGFQSFILEPDDINDPNNTTYFSNAFYPNGVDQEYTVFNRGYDRKFTFNLGAQYKENLFLGVNLNVHDVDFRKVSIIDEIGFDFDSSSIQSIYFENDLYTFGEGFSFQVGGIARVNDDVRLGVTYQSPTWYRLNDELIQYVETTRINPADPSNPDADLLEIVDPRVVNIYEQYRIKTPSKLNGSFAYVFGKQGLISFDYIRTDYSNAELRPEGDFQGENNFIADVLRATNEYRVGGEYRINQLRLRGGYRFAEGPFEDESTIGDLEGYSLGLGYDFGGAAIDVAYEHSEQERNQQLFPVGLTDRANINGINDIVTVTFSLKL